MKRFEFEEEHRRLAAAALLMAAVAAFAASPGLREATFWVKEAWAAMSVIDHANLDRNTKILAESKQQSQQLKEILGRQKEIENQLGALRRGHGDAGGILGVIQDLLKIGAGTPLGVSRAQDTLKPRFAKVEGKEVWADPNGAPSAEDPEADFTTLDSSRAFVDEQLITVRSGRLPDTTAVDRRRDLVYEDAVATSLALALQNRESAASAAERLRRLAEDAARAETAREDANAQKAIELAILDELMALRGLMAAQLALGAARDLRGERLAFSPKAIKGESEAAAPGVAGSVFGGQ